MGIRKNIVDQMLEGAHLLRPLYKIHHWKRGTPLVGMAVKFEEMMSSVVQKIKCMRERVRKWTIESLSTTGSDERVFE